MRGAGRFREGTTPPRRFLPRRSNPIAVSGSRSGFSPPRPRPAVPERHGLGGSPGGGGSACRTSHGGAVSPHTCPAGGVGEPSGRGMAAVGPAEQGLARNARRHSCPLLSTCPRRAGFHWLDPLSASPPSPSRETPAKLQGNYVVRFAFSF